MLVYGQSYYKRQTQTFCIVNLKSSRLYVFLCSLALCFISVLSLYSISGGKFYVWAYKQMMYVFLGLFVMFFTAGFKDDFIRRKAYLMLIVSVGFLAFVKVGGTVGMGAKRWIDFKFFSLQPSEVFKLCSVLAFARLFDKIETKSLILSFFDFAFLLCLFLCGVILIILQPDFTTFGVCLMIVAGMFFGAGIRAIFIIISSVVSVFGMIFGWFFVLHDYQKNRVLTFLNPESDPLAAGYNAIQSKIAVGSGGFFGKGLFKGTQVQLSYLPEKHTDFIFTSISEEMGLLIATFILFLYGYIFYYINLVAHTSKTVFQKMTVLGCGMFIFTHVAINIFMVLGMFPVAGIPLPFLSYGGTSMLMNMAAIGIIMGIDYRTAN